MAQKINPPSEVVKKVRDHYKVLVLRSAEALQNNGKQSAEYAACLIALSTTVACVEACYGFDTLKEAHTWLRNL